MTTQMQVHTSNLIQKIKANKKLLVFSTAGAAIGVSAILAGNTVYESPAVRSVESSVAQREKALAISLER